MTATHRAHPQHQGVATKNAASTGIGQGGHTGHPSVSIVTPCACTFGPTRMRVLYRKSGDGGVAGVATSRKPQFVQPLWGMASGPKGWPGGGRAVATFARPRSGWTPSGDSIVRLADPRRPPAQKRWRSPSRRGGGAGSAWTPKTRRTPGIRSSEGCRLAPRPAGRLDPWSVAPGKGAAVWVAFRGLLSRGPGGLGCLSKPLSMVGGCARGGRDVAV